MSDNLTLWQSVEKTDPKHVKGITGKSYQGNSPKPHYLVHKATETFGPCGIGWGFTIEDERIEEGAGGERMSIARVKVWFKWDGERGEVEHVGGTQFSGVRSSGKTFTDEDAPKKSVTDALVKALSMIGFAGDIFMGRYDDSKYVAEIREEFTEPEQPEQPQKRQVGWSKDGTTRTANSLKKEGVWDEFQMELRECETVAMVTKLALAWSKKVEEDKWPESWKEQLREEMQKRRDFLKSQPAPDDDTFPGDLPSKQPVNTLGAM